jgi:hypothetical protein
LTKFHAVVRRDGTINDGSHGQECCGRLIRIQLAGDGQALDVESGTGSQMQGFA